MADEGLKLPTSSYEELTKIIMGYSKSKVPVTPGELSVLTAQPADPISRNNAFLLSIGVIEGGNKKGITEQGLALARALDHEMPDEITENWRKTIEEIDFFQKILTAIKIRKGMDGATLQSHIAYSAGQAKNNRVMVGAKTIIDILRAAGFIADTDGKYTVINTGFEQKSIETRTDISMSGEHSVLNIVQNPPTKIGVPNLETDLGISIQIQIQCSANELDGLGVKLKKLLREISSSQDQQDELKDKEADQNVANNSEQPEPNLNNFSE